MPKKYRPQLSHKEKEDIRLYFAKNIVSTDDEKCIIHYLALENIAIHAGIVQGIANTKISSRFKKLDFGKELLI